MSEEQDLMRAQIDILELFYKIFCTLKGGKKEPNQYFQVQTQPNAPYTKLLSLFDKQTFQCYSQQEIERSLQQIVNNTDMYNSLINNAIHLEKKVDAKSIFTPEIFNSLGGQQSDILLNSSGIALSSNNGMLVNLINGATNTGYDKIYLAKQHDSNYIVQFFGSVTNSERFENVNAKDIQSLVKREAQLNEKAYLDNKTGKQIFSENEIPKSDLKRVGIKWDDLSAVNKKALLDGKETSSLTIQQQMGVKKQYTHGHLRLARTGGDKAEVMFRPMQNIATKIMLKR